MLRTSGVHQPSVWPNVVSEDAVALRNWLIALGFTHDLLIPGEGGASIHHCQLNWPDGGRVILSSTGERDTPCVPGTAWNHVVTADPDAVFALAERLDAEIVRPLIDQQEYPAREFTLADPDGNRWTFSTFAG